MIREGTPRPAATGGQVGAPRASRRRPEDGFCFGQFRVTAEESPTRVTVSQVHDTDPLFSLERDCGGIGVRDGLASAELTLRAPVGDRPVYRDVDGAPLEVRR